jgi:hypothetical protein
MDIFLYEKKLNNFKVFGYKKKNKKKKKKIGSKKATDVDNLPTKLLKAGSPTINIHLCELVNWYFPR